MKATLIFTLLGALIVPTQAQDKKLIEAANKAKEKASDKAGGLVQRLTPDDSLQGVEGQLQGLYAQRNSIIKGLHDLGYEVCMKSRIGTVDNLIGHLSKPKRKNEKRYAPEVSVVWDCPPNAKCLPPSFAENNNRIVLPLLNQPHAYKTEFKKTQIVERLLNFEDRRDKSKDEKQKMREQGKKIGFHRNFFNRNSCLAGAGIHRACRLLSGDQNFKDPKMKRLAALLEKHPEFKLRFNKDLACEVSDSKKDYIEKLRPVQETIVEFENKLKKARKGIDDDGKLSCAENDQGVEVCQLVYETQEGTVCNTNDNGVESCYVVDYEKPPIANHPAGEVCKEDSNGVKECYIVDDKNPPVANHPREPASDNMTCRRAEGTNVEFCFDAKQNRYRCETNNGKRYCRPY